MDDLKTIQNLIDDYIDPQGAPGSVLAENHNQILSRIVDSVGKYCGVPYLANKTLTGYPPGTMSWNNNALNNTETFTTTFAKLSTDLNDLEHILKRMEIGGLVHFKDYVGRSAYFEFQGYTPKTSPDIYDVLLKAVPENTSYAYQTGEVLFCVFEFFPTLAINPA